MDTTTPNPGRDQAADQIEDDETIVDMQDTTTVLTDGTTVLGDQLGGTINVDYREDRVPNNGSRKRLKQNYRALVKHELTNKSIREDEPLPTEEEIDAEYRRRVAKATEQRQNIQGALDEVAPASTAPDAKTVDEEVQVAAVLRLPVFIWAWLRLLRLSSGPRLMPMWRRLAVATIMRMAVASVHPCAKRILKPFCRANRFLAWTHLWPGEPPTYPPEQGPWDISACYKQIKKVLSAATPVSMWAAANRAALLELLGEHSFDPNPRRGGRFANVPNALTYLVVDAILIEADLPQRKPRDDEEARRWRGTFRQRCGFVIYKNAFGRFKKCHGYKWVQISSIKLGGLVLIGGLVPANVDERKATLKLLEKLFALWPELQMQKNIYLVGDSLYDNSENFAYELTFRFGIHGVFPRHGKVAGKYDHRDTEGVPTCECNRRDKDARDLKPGEREHELATIDEAADFPTPLYRLKRGLAPAGQYIPKDDQRPTVHEDGTMNVDNVVDNARIRWRCANPNARLRCDFRQDTYLRENPRLYTYLPHNGGHDRAALRVALLCYRNVIESNFSSLKEMGFAGSGQARPRWAGDAQMEHLAWMCATTMTARRLVHFNGLYSRVRAEAEQLGLLMASLPTESTPAIPRSEWAEMEETLLRSQKAPRGWEHVDLDMGDYRLLLPDDEIR